MALGLSYFRARMRLREHPCVIQFASTRTHLGAPAPRFEAIWARGAPPPQAVPGSLDFFLVERYCLYTTCRGHLSRVRIFHAKPGKTPTLWVKYLTVFGGYSERVCFEQEGYTLDKARAWWM